TRGCAATWHKFNQSKNNRYQQTWHTIEFSNNRSLFQSSTTSLRWIAPEQLFKLTRSTASWQISVSAIFDPILGPTCYLHARKRAIFQAVI
ncbi:hypothetical protein ACIQC5_22600, partial [Paenarthrobacter sp. NPDC092416]|uniref:hypothetical protein n=1 Tax=Paenarthrobacter sp. NPDC092416 TaxID=3364386 RepID=UPI00381C6DBE